MIMTVILMARYKMRLKKQLDQNKLFCHHVSELHHHLDHHHQFELNINLSERYCNFHLARGLRRLHRRLHPPHHRHQEGADADHHFDI